MCIRDSEKPAPALVTAKEELEKYLSAVFGKNKATEESVITLAVDDSLPEEGYRLRCLLYTSCGVKVSHTPPQFSQAFFWCV